MKSRFITILSTAVLMLLAVTVMINPVAAGSAQSLPTISMTCNTFTQAGGGRINPDRDNTDAGAERFRIEITDGTGKILAADQHDVLIASEYLDIFDGTFPMEPASANPIRYRLVSVAGNGLPEQVFIDVSLTVADIGNCSETTTPPVRHLNQGDCDDSRVYIYAGTDTSGKDALNVYRSVSATQGAFTFNITEADVAAQLAVPPDQNTLIKSNEGYELYILTTGELQINTPYDFEGKSCIVILNGLRPSVIYSYEIKR